MSGYQTSEKTRQALIEAAGELAAEHGFNAVSTRAIAERADENIGSIHYHFGGKEKLFDAVMHAVAKRWTERPLDELVDDCNLETAAGQADAIRQIFQRKSDLLFDADKPDWHSRVVYQILQTRGALQDIFRSLVIDPDLTAVARVLKAIDPTIDDEGTTLHYLLMFTPLFSHADYEDTILLKLGKNVYDSNYIRRLVETCIKQTLLLHGLPLE